MPNNILEICPNCGSPVSLKNSEIVYGKDYGWIYLCDNYPTCNSFVGTHRGTIKPLGTLANKELRELRKECHRLFDLRWKSGIMNRKQAYKLLQEIMNLSEKDAHIAMFNKEQCVFLIDKLGIPNAR